MIKRLEEIERELEDVSGQIRIKLKSLVESEPAWNKPGRINTKIASEVMKLEEHQWELIKEMVLHYKASQNV